MARAQVPLGAHEPAHRARATEESIAKLAECPMGTRDWPAPVAAAHDADEDRQRDDDKEMEAGDVEVELEARGNARRPVELDTRHLPHTDTGRAPRHSEKRAQCSGGGRGRARAGNGTRCLSPWAANGRATWKSIVPQKPSSSDEDEFATEFGLAAPIAAEPVGARSFENVGNGARGQVCMRWPV